MNEERGCKTGNEEWVVYVCVCDKVLGLGYMKKL